MRDAILRAAADLFAEHGIDNVSFDEIAATAGITASQLRAYFTSTTGVHNALDQQEGARDVRPNHPQLVA
jgi:AcrR family transcriptional regulator